MICKGQIAEENRMFFEEKFYVLAGYKSAYYERLALLPPPKYVFLFFAVNDANELRSLSNIDLSSLRSCDNFDNPLLAV